MPAHRLNGSLGTSQSIKSLLHAHDSYFGSQPGEKLFGGVARAHSPTTAAGSQPTSPRASRVGTPSDLVSRSGASGIGVGGTRSASDWDPNLPRGYLGSSCVIIPPRPIEAEPPPSGSASGSMARLRHGLLHDGLDHGSRLTESLSSATLGHGAHPPATRGRDPSAITGSHLGSRLGSMSRSRHGSRHGSRGPPSGSASSIYFTFDSGPPIDRPRDLKVRRLPRPPRQSCACADCSPDVCLCVVASMCIALALSACTLRVHSWYHLSCGVADARHHACTHPCLAYVSPSHLASGRADSPPNLGGLNERSHPTHPTR